MQRPNFSFKNALSINLLVVGFLSVTSTLAITPLNEIADGEASRNVALTESNTVTVRPSIGYEVVSPGHNRVAVQPNSVIQASGRDDKIPYGNNPQAGRYVDVGDAKLYYEVYGKGQPLVLLHGGVYGYIDEFAPLIAKLSSSYQVICLATRGHGKSQIGSTPFTWQQRADDAYKLIRSITQDSVLVLGFSDGAFAGYKLAAMYPQVVKRLIAIGAGDAPQGARKDKANYSPEMLMGQAKDFFEGRKALMPEPNRWGECLTKINKLYNDDYVSAETFEKIACPVLVMSGDRDDYYSIDRVTQAAKRIANSQLSIIPGCPHVVFFCNFAAVWEAMRPFLEPNRRS